MSALPNVQNVVKLQLRFNHGAAGISNVVLHWLYSGTPPSPTDASAICTRAQAAYATNLASLAHTSVVFTGVTLTDLASTGGTQFIGSASTPGTLTGQPVAAAVALLQTLNIKNRYRGGKPRTYWPFGNGANLLDDEHWNPTFLTSATTGLQAWQAALTNSVNGSTTMQQQVAVSYYSGNKGFIDPTTGRAYNVPQKKSTPDVYPITGFVVQSIPGSQRRRMRRH